jgi:hypothetical protein
MQDIDPGILDRQHQPPSHFGGDRFRLPFDHNDRHTQRSFASSHDKSP